MQYKDYYEILGVARAADADEVKRAYRKLARKYHPDVSKEKNAESKFKEVQEAYEVLRDAEKRAAYDQLGRDYRPGQQFRPPPDWGQRFGQQGSERFSDMNGFSDFFSSLFGGAAQGAAAPKTEAGYLDVTVEEAFAGTKRRVMLNEGGRARHVDVQIPPGVVDGQSLRIAAGGGRGSLIFRIRLRPHALYAVAGQGCAGRTAAGALGGGLGRQGGGAHARRHGRIDHARGRTIGPEAAFARPRLSRHSRRRSDRQHQTGDARGAVRRRRSRPTSG